MYLMTEAQNAARGDDKELSCQGIQEGFSPDAMIFGKSDSGHCDSVTFCFGGNVYLNNPRVVQTD